MSTNTSSIELETFGPDKKTVVVAVPLLSRNDWANVTMEGELVRDSDDDEQITVLNPDDGVLRGIGFVADRELCFIRFAKQESRMESGRTITGVRRVEDAEFQKVSTWGDIRLFLKKGAPAKEIVVKSVDANGAVFTTLVEVNASAVNGS